MFLKPNSPEFIDNPKKRAQPHGCDMPGCAHKGEHKAPKHRGLNEYYHFCIEHVREYNKAWNFFEGLSDTEVQNHMNNSWYGDRPTWKYGVNGTADDALYDKIWETYHDSAPPKREQKRQQHPHIPAPEYEALAIMGLEPPIDLKAIKVRYKELAKKHHPDLNRGCTKSEELLKQINMAYTILKVAYEAYDKLPER